MKVKSVDFRNQNVATLHKTSFHMLDIRRVVANNRSNVASNYVQRRIVCRISTSVI